MSTTRLTTYEKKLTNKRDYWRDIIFKWQSTDLSVPDYCRTTGLDKDQFNYWRRKYTDIIPESCAKQDGFVELKLNKENKKTTLAPIKTTSLDKPCSEINLQLEITLANNILLKLKTPFSHLPRLISILGARKC